MGDRRAEYLVFQTFNHGTGKGPEDWYLTDVGGWTFNPKRARRFERRWIAAEVVEKLYPGTRYKVRIVY